MFTEYVIPSPVVMASCGCWTIMPNPGIELSGSIPVGNWSLHSTISVVTLSVTLLASFVLAFCVACCF